ncbi:MAG: RHS repeat-associated core domain-containing protein, partial [Candidatus Competibacteraceae bacterium]|nr:RHS repeat-associated core domain-containing protein [Candidatus Competibacteraceae bacterium]
MTSDGTNTYEWDAENRLIKINYPGMGNSSEFRLDALSRTVVAVETVDGAVEGTDQFVWSVVDRAELRDGLGSVKDQYYIRGVKEGINLRFYSQDLLGSIMELTDSLGTIKARYQYEPFGVATETQGPESSDFGFAGYYQCRRSGLSSTLFRFYSAKLARWINRDPILEKGGINLYQYSFNSPASIIDPSGLDSHNIPAAELARNLSIPLSALRGGCFDIVNAALKMPPGTRPDKYKTTKCFYG